ncbi:unannotated protein [freshwater metagenome]|uniref:ribulose-phosphate 3-epimerase n=1 Tax=freshwater metagenome TaxID=449393 RepID=A0A6J6TEZ1_9ZZZZ|nr:ribulose-phosphate 3-epimerase [Actinomycetota bacterium]
MGVLISPSVLNSDLARLADEVGRIAQAADFVHLDVMDNHFVPNLTFGLPVIESLLRDCPVPADCHLMIADPDRWAPAYAEAGAASVTFHVEAAQNPVAICGSIRSAGARAGVAVKPGTDVEDLADILPCLDMILVMTVEPGFGGQSFMTDMLPKIRRARALADASGTDVWIQVDGGIDVSNIERCADAGASIFVAGSAVFRDPDPSAMIERLRALANRASTR